MISKAKSQYGKNTVKFWDREVRRYSLGQIYKRGRNVSLVVDHSGVTLTVPNRDIYSIMADVPRRPDPMLDKEAHNG